MSILKRISCFFCVVVLVFISNVKAVADSVPVTREGYTHEEFIRMIAEYYNDNPGDFEGLADLAVELGADEPEFSFPRAGLSGMDGVEAQRIVDGGGGRAELQGVPVNAFSVSTAWYRTPLSNGTVNYSFVGYWNFRDNYVNGSAPDDVSALVVENLPSCWRYRTDIVYMHSFNGGNYSSDAYRYDVTPTSSIWRVRDRARNFALTSDHGSHYLVYNRYTSRECSKRNVYGKFYYEKNQDGGGSWSASVNIKYLSVSYSGNPGSVLRKASPLDYYN